MASKLETTLIVNIEAQNDVLKQLRQKWDELQAYYDGTAPLVDRLLRIISNEPETQKALGSNRPVLEVVAEVLERLMREPKAPAVYEQPWGNRLAEIAKE